MKLCTTTINKLKFFLVFLRFFIKIPLFLITPYLFWSSKNLHKIVISALFHCENSSFSKKSTSVYISLQTMNGKDLFINFFAFNNGPPVLSIYFSLLYEICTPNFPSLKYFLIIDDLYFIQKTNLLNP